MTQQAKWGQRPTKSKKASPAAAKLNSFVNGGKRTKRLNVEIPAALHTRLKAACALEEREIRDVVMELLEQRFPESMK